MIPSPSSPVLREALVRLAMTRLYSAASALGSAQCAPDQKDKKPFAKQVDEARTLMGEALEAIDQATEVGAPTKLTQDLVLVGPDGEVLTTGSSVRWRDECGATIKAIRHDSGLVDVDIISTMESYYACDVKCIGARWMFAAPISPTPDDDKILIDSKGLELRVGGDLAHEGHYYLITAINRALSPNRVICKRNGKTTSFHFDDLDVQWINRSDLAAKPAPSDLVLIDEDGNEVKVGDRVDCGLGWGIYQGRAPTIENRHLHVLFGAHKGPHTMTPEEVNCRLVKRSTLQAKRSGRKVPAKAGGVRKVRAKPVKMGMWNDPRNGEAD